MAVSSAIESIQTYNPNATKYVDESTDAEQMRIDFLTMLTAQLEYQDPMEPMQNTDMTAQMAQFSSLEEQQRGNSLLERLLASQNSSEVNQAVSFIGRQVVTEGSRLNVADGDGRLGFELNEPAIVKITIFDEGGAPIKVVSSRQYDSGEHKVDINNPANGDPIDDGAYTFSVSIVESVSGEAAKATELEVGIVSGVNNGKSGVKLDLNGRSVDLGAVRRVERADP